MKIPFDLKKAKGGMKVVTPYGKEVRIICWDRDYGYPLVGLMRKDTPPYYECITVDITEQGKTFDGIQLMLEDGEPELTPTEEALVDIIKEVKRSYLPPVAIAMRYHEKILFAAKQEMKSVSCENCVFNSKINI